MRTGQLQHLWHHLMLDGSSIRIPNDTSRDVAQTICVVCKINTWCCLSYTVDRISCFDVNDVNASLDCTAKGHLQYEHTCPTNNFLGTIPLESSAFGGSANRTTSGLLPKVVLPCRASLRDQPTSRSFQIGQTRHKRKEKMK